MEVQLQQDIGKMSYNDVVYALQTFISAFPAVKVGGQTPLFEGDGNSRRTSQFVLR